MKNSTGITDDESEVLVQSGLVVLRSIHSINLSGTSISDRGLIGLKKYSKSRESLREIVLNRCFNITDEGIENILDGFKELEILSFAQCSPSITSKSTSMLSEYFEERKTTSNCQDVKIHHNSMKHIGFTIW